jgi:hypothetical protein
MVPKSQNPFISNSRLARIRVKLERLPELGLGKIPSFIVDAVRVDKIAN